MGSSASSKARIAGAIASARARSSSSEGSSSAASVAATSASSASVIAPDGSVGRVPRVDPLDRRVVLAHLPTPLEPMPRLAAHLGMAEDSLWVKRDDCTGLAGGGNKARKLEYLCEDAQVHGCDTLVTGGGRQSNHVRMTAAAANKLGMHCTVVLGSDRPSVPSGNVVLDELLGPELVWAGPLDYYGVEAAIDHATRRLAE